MYIIVLYHNMLKVSCYRFFSMKISEWGDRNQIFENVFLLFGFIILAKFVSFFLRKDVGFISSPYILEVIFLFLYTMPFYIAFLALGVSIMHKLKQAQYVKGEVILNVISCVMACFIFLTAFNIANLLYIALGLSTILIILRIVIMVIYKRKMNIFVFVKQKAFWLCTSVILLTVIFVMAILYNFSSSKNRYDDSNELNTTKTTFYSQNFE